MIIISGILRNRHIATPKGIATRPTASRVRACVFNMLQNKIEEARFLDICAGSGAMGIEALSRGALHTTFIENDRAAIQAIRKNIETFALQKSTTLIIIDAFAALKKLSKENASFDIIYFDPPYSDTKNASSFITDIVSFIDKNLLLTPHGILFVEDRAKSPVDSLELYHLMLKSKRSLGEATLREFSGLM